MSKIDKNTDFFAYVDNFVRYKHIQSIRVYGKHEIPAPKVSITIPTYRRPELLKEAVESAVNQIDYSNYEIVIVDNDASGEYTEQIIEMLNSFATNKIVYYKNQENIGMFGNWNRCIELAHGDWMTILGDDDIIFPNYLATMVLNIDTNEQLIECKQRNFKEKISYEVMPHNLNYRKFKLNLKRYALGNRAIIHSQLFKTENAKKIGGFNLDYYPFADYMFQTSYLYHFNSAYKISIHLVGYRWAVNESLKRETVYQQINGLKMYKEYFKRKLNLKIFQRAMLEFLLVKFKWYYFSKFVSYKRISLNNKLLYVIACIYNGVGSRIYK